MHTYRLWNVDADKLVMGRHVTFNERSVINRSKAIEINDSETVIEPINGGESDKMRNNPFETTDDEFTDANDTTIRYENVHDVTDDIGNNEKNVHDVTDGTGYNERNVHGANKDGIGNDKKNVHGATDGTGNIEIRRSQRECKPVQRYGEWEYDAYFALSAQQYVQDDPISIKDAKQRIDWSDWKKAIDDEYSSLIKNGTWLLCNLPKDRRTISCKWLFKLKHKTNGEIDKYKARLVARDFIQEKGFDYNETYSPTGEVDNISRFSGNCKSLWISCASNGCQVRIFESATG